MARTKLKVVYEPYERYSSSGVRTATVSGVDRLDALKRMADHMSLWIDSEGIEEDDMTADEVIERIEYSNGDGCDYIYTIEDLTTGETILADGEYEEDDWDDDLDEEDDEDIED